MSEPEHVAWLWANLDTACDALRVTTTRYQWLKAQLAEARRVLRLVEWMGDEYRESCPRCHRRNPAASKLVATETGHAPDCALAKVLEDAP